MTTSELSNEFDILFNNISSNKAPGLEPYEKSVLLTTTQVTSMAALTRNTGEQAISVASKNLDVFATSADATVEYLAKGSARAALEGLNVKKYSVVCFVCRISFLQLKKVCNFAAF
jgi:hypothetical protein